MWLSQQQQSLAFCCHLKHSVLFTSPLMSKLGVVQQFCTLFMFIVLACCTACIVEHVQHSGLMCKQYGINAHPASMMYCMCISVLQHVVNAALIAQVLTVLLLSNLIHDYIPTRTNLLLTIHRMSLTIFSLSLKSFSLSSPSDWNSLLYSCRSTKTVTAFKRALKTQLFAIAYGSH